MGGDKPPDLSGSCGLCVQHTFYIFAGRGPNGYTNEVSGQSGVFCCPVQSLLLQHPDSFFTLLTLTDTVLLQPSAQLRALWSSDIWDGALCWNRPL